jgi:stage V sporulation protein K
MDERARDAGSLRRSDVTSLHMVFSGNPGTGKTTVARLVGKIYRKLGILKGDDIFVECSRETLVGQYIGETAQLVRRKVESALGGVLFIDEAYSLYRADDPKDFGREAIDTLIKYMEDYRENLVIIMAGYSELMAEMIEQANPGLQSRFRIWIEFEDYTVPEMCDIFRKMVKDRNCRLDPEADGELLTDVITKCSGKEGFGNARGVRNLLELVLEKLNERIAKRFQERLPVTKEDFDTIRAEDLRSALEETEKDAPPEAPTWQPPRIGF